MILYQPRLIGRGSMRLPRVSDRAEQRPVSLLHAFYGVVVGCVRSVLLIEKNRSPEEWGGKEETGKKKSKVEMREVG